MARLKPYLRPYLGLVAGSCLLAIPLAALRFAPIPLVKYLVDDLLVRKDPGMLLLVPVAIVGLFLLNFPIRFFHYYLLRKVIIGVNRRLKSELYRHTVGLSADHFTEKSTGNLMSRVASDPNLVDPGIACINVVVREPLTLALLLGYTFYVNWRLTLLTVVIVPLLAWVFVATARNLKRYVSRLTEENAATFSSLQETFTGIRVVKAFRLENYVRETYDKRISNYVRFYLKVAKLEEVSHPMVELLIAVAIAVALYFGSAEVVGGRLTPGELFAFFVAFARMMAPIQALNEVNLKVAQASAAADRIFEVLSWRSRITEAREPVRIGGVEREIRFDRVSFSYPDSPDRQVLRQVSFTIPRGKVVAIVGSSGSGKSTIAHLMPRLYDPDEGALLLDGVDIRRADIGSLRDQVAVVSQDVFLFNDTLRENIRCGRLDATDAEIEAAARRANAHDFIQALPAGYETVVGDRGQKLSGGERQRISIARAFLRRAPILVLDEATSSLDSTSEKIVQGALDELMRERTTLVIAHRLSTVRQADRILVMKDGRIVESGTHHELIGLNGEYSRFHRENFAG